MRTLYIVGGAGVAGILALLWSRKDGSGDGPTGGSFIVNTNLQAVNRGIVLSQFAARGYHPNVGRAAWVNAMAESAGDNNAIGDNGHAVGLFQISDLNGKRNLTGVDRTDAAASCLWLFNNEGGALAKVALLANNGGSLASVTAAFCALVERPRDIAGESVRRGAAAAKLFPGVV